MTAALAALTLVAVLGATTGCTRVRIQDTPNARTIDVSDTFQLQGATELQAVVRQGVGELRLRGSSDATDSVKSDFAFAPESWRPEIVGSVEGTRASLRISQPSRTDVQPFSDMRNDWDITLPKGVATDLSLELGVGSSDVDLRGIDLTRLSAMTGVGDTTIDLSGERAADLTARIESGVGSLTLRLPRSVGVRITSQAEGIGDFTVEGERVTGGIWENQSYAGTGPKIDIVLHRGIGDVKIELVD